MNEGGQIEKPLDYLVANLLDFFRDPKNERKFIQAAKIAMNQISRMATNNAMQLEKRYIFFASKLKNNVSPISVRHFARECFESATKSGFVVDNSASAAAKNSRSIHKKAQQELSNSLASGHSEASAIQRAANVLIKNKREIEKNDRVKKLAMTHPLKDTLEILTMHNRPLAKEDIKSQFLQLKRWPGQENSKQGTLFRLLEKTQAFSTCRLHYLLGDELFFLCRPLGFLDQAATILIVEVPSNAHLHALTYRKLEILRSLKKDATFKSLKNIRFKVKSSAF